MTNDTRYTYIEYLGDIHGTEGIGEHIEDDLLGLALGHDDLATPHGRGSVLPLLEHGLEGALLGLGGLGGGLVGGGGGCGGGCRTTRGDGGGRNAAGIGLGGLAALAALLGLGSSSGGRRDESLAGWGSDGTTTCSGSGGGGRCGSRRSGRLGLGRELCENLGGNAGGLAIVQTSGTVAALVDDEGTVGVGDGVDGEVPGRRRGEPSKEAVLALDARVPGLLVLGTLQSPDGAGCTNAELLGTLVVGIANLTRAKDGDEVPNLRLLLLGGVGIGDGGVRLGDVCLGGGSIGIAGGILGGRILAIIFVGEILGGRSILVAVVGDSGNGAVGGSDLLGGRDDLSSSAGSGSNDGDHGFCLLFGCWGWWCIASVGKL